MNIDKLNQLLDEIWDLQVEAARYLQHYDPEQYWACYELIQEKFLILRAMISSFAEQNVRVIQK
jgi:tryptophan 2,3-dioxygenase